MLTLHLTIDLGNDAMDSAGDVADLLTRLAQGLTDLDEIPVSIALSDRNGNRVGWLRTEGEA